MSRQSVPATSTRAGVHVHAAGRTGSRLVSTVLLAALVCLAAGAPAGAFEIRTLEDTPVDGQVALSPAAERVTTTERGGSTPVGPGTTAKRSIIVHNRTDSPIAVTLDVAQVVGAGPDEVVQVRHGVREGAAAWVTLERARVQLKPKQQATVGVTIAVPTKVTPGSKTFAVTAMQRPAPTSQVGSSGVDTIFSQNALFIVELPGEAPVRGELRELRLDAVDRDGMRESADRRVLTGDRSLVLTVEYANEGERVLTPQGAVEVRDLFGRVVSRTPIRRFTVYPGGANGAEVRLRGVPALGWLRTTVRIDEGIPDKDAVERTLPAVLLMPAWLAPLLALLVTLLLTWLAAALADYTSARRRFVHAGEADAEDELGDIDGPLE